MFYNHAEERARRRTQGAQLRQRGILQGDDNDGDDQSGGGDGGYGGGGLRGDLAWASAPASTMKGNTGVGGGEGGGAGGRSARGERLATLSSHFRGRRNEDQRSRSVSSSDNRR